MFKDFLLDAVSSGNTEFDYDSPYAAIRLLTQFNLEIDSIVNHFGAEKAGTAIWYCYGCVSGMIHDVLDEKNRNSWSSFYESMKSLYANGFAKHCENIFNHPLRQTKFGTACYMLWDMDGIEHLTFDRSIEQRTLAEPLIDFGITHDHVVIQESFLHCLGHQIQFHPKFAAPKIQFFLGRKGLCAEIIDYAKQCKTGMIL